MNSLTFWSEPMGLFITASMFFCSCFNIWHKGVDDNWFDRIWYCAMATVTLCAFILGIRENDNPNNIVQTIFMMFCLRMIVNVFVRYFTHKKTGKPCKTMR
ncbi:hypothetical protein [Pectobacterium phage Wc4-1]|uniref:Holin n=1 Tax=Pectobacterium phage Wc4 TaxID=2652428 RepID=A0A5P8D470_9CAUD|nr:hypothetical protein [Pectobacterium phage Wc4]QFP93993.1 hypothetical protein [Pectobacterium phage Wc4-1]